MTFSAKAVGLVASPHSDSIRPLLSGVLSAAGLELVDADQPDFGPLAGVIEVSDARTEAMEGSRCGSWPSFRLRLADGWDEARTVAFADSGTLPAVLRGRKVVTDVAFDPFGTSMVGETLAESLSGPLWTSSTHGGHRHDTCLLPRPAVHERSRLFDHLNGRSFMGFLPVIDWARSLAGWQHWQKPPIRACFMIDDPNLHATRYGFVSYEGLAMEGRRHGFHTSLATVPLDQFYVSRAASDLLRKNTKVLSLLVHGNNHTHRELAGSETPSRKLEMIRQALARIERLERKSGLTVARVMAPPHGACSAAMMSTLAHAGFDAACISHGSVHAANSGQVWATALGADPVTVINGLPVIPRFGLGHDIKSQMLLSAYLGQPILPMGHHWDFQDGVTALINAAESIRELGGTWADMATIARGNFHWRVEGTTLRVRSYSRSFRLDVPEGIEILSIAVASLGESVAEFTCRALPGGHLLEALGVEGCVASFRMPRSCQVQVSAVLDGSAAPGGARLVTPPHALLRRALAETRDRAMPWLPRVARRGRN